jgi:hypothetical protein
MGDNELKPDFSMLFDNDYGIVGEIARSIDSSEDVLASKAAQLKRYDSDLQFKADGSGRTVQPKIHDILLLLHSDYSNKGAIALNDFWERNKDMRPRNNVVVMEYNFSTGDAQCKYLFKKLLYEKNGVFRDETLPVHLQLERKLGVEAAPLKLAPKHFVSCKAVNIFCNDKPPTIYLATRLWDRIFPTLLTEEQMRVWRKGSSTKVQRIATTSRDLELLLTQQVLPGCTIRKDWIEEALEFLATAGRAQRNDSTWEVLYSNLRMKKRKSGVTEDEASLEKMREYGDMLAEMYCQGLKGQAPILEEEPAEEVVQRSLLDFE